jgi:hypothetical protein
MKRMLIAACFLCCLVLTAVGGTKTGNAAATAPEARYSIELDYEPMSNALIYIRTKYGERICFEDIDWDVHKDTVTLAEAIAGLERTAGERALLPGEERMLRNLRDIRAHGIDARSVIDQKHKRLTGRYAGSSMEGLLDAVTKGSRYTWKKVSETYVVLPSEGSILAFPVTVTAEDAPLLDVLREIGDQSPKQKIGLGMSTAGPVPPEAVDPRVEAQAKARVKHLDLKGVSATEALCRAVEAAEPRFSWELAGYSGSRHLGILASPQGDGKAAK